MTMQKNIGMGGHTVTNIGTPTNDTDAANKKYVDDKKCKFKDGSTNTDVVDLRDTGLNGSLELYNNITFDGGAYCRDLNSSTSTGKEIVNKNTLETGHLVTLQSITPSLSRMLQTAIKKETIAVQGTPTKYSKIYADLSVNGEPTFTTDASSCEFTVSFNSALPNGIYTYIFDIFLTTWREVKVFLYGECGGTGYIANSWYKYTDTNSSTNITQNDLNGGYFQKAAGKSFHIEGKFRNCWTHVVNYGKAYSLASDGTAHDFVIQKLKVTPTETQVLGMSMTWLFENARADGAVTLEDDSYFYIAKDQVV